MTRQESGEDLRPGPRDSSLLPVAPTRPRRQEVEERPFHPGGGFGNLAIELYSAGEARYVFDARKVVFIEVGRRVFLLLQLLRDRDLDVDGAVSALPELSESEVRQAFLEVRKLQEKGYLLPSDLRRSSPHRRRLAIACERRFVGIPSL